MTSTLDVIKRQTLQRRLDAHIEEYQAVSDAISSSLDPEIKLRLKRKLESIEQEMKQVESELNALGASTPATHEASSDSRQPARMPLPDATQVNRSALRDAIVARFTGEELETLCLNIQQDRQDDGLSELVSLDIVGGRSLVMQSQNLIGWLERRGQLGYLIRLIREQRPDAI